MVKWQERVMAGMSNIKDIEDRLVLDVYPRRDIVITRGSGSRLFDASGKEYIDCASNVGVSSIGHANACVADAIHKQYLRLSNCYSMFYNDVRAELAQKLVSIAPIGLNKLFFCNSGTEAVEAAIKFARASTGRSEIICAMRGFHGKTMGSLGATWGPEYKTPFLPMLEGFVHVPFDSIERLSSQVTDKTAAVLLEVVQGEGGVRVGSPDFFRKARELCDIHGALLIIDEVQTGFGRTGKMFACEHYTTPDILCLAKAIAGGVPMGAVLCNSRIIVPKKSHTSTFGGNPLACAAALASINFIEENRLVEKSASLGDYFLAELKKIKSEKIKEVRGLGLMIGIELTKKAGPYVSSLTEQGVIALLAGNFVIRLLPPLVISKEEIDIVISRIKSVLQC